MKTLFQDLRFAFRVMRKRPGLDAVGRSQPDDQELSPASGCQSRRRGTGSKHLCSGTGDDGLDRARGILFSCTARFKNRPIDDASIPIGFLSKRGPALAALQSFADKVADLGGAQAHFTGRLRLHLRARSNDRLLHILPGPFSRGVALLAADHPEQHGQ